MILQVGHPDSFEYFRPISLFNMVYKLMAKMLALRIKSLLLDCITNENFGFLKNRHIHEAIGTE